MVLVHKQTKNWFYILNSKKKNDKTNQTPVTTCTLMQKCNRLKLLETPDSRIVHFFLSIHCCSVKIDLIVSSFLISWNSK